MPNKPPVHEIRVGRVKAVLWENESASGVYYNATVVRLYKDGDDWKESASFSRDDLPLVQLVLGRAYEWMYEGYQRDEAESPSDQAA